MKGSYILLIYLKNNRDIMIGKRRNIFFKKGWYVYVGSALNNLELRIKRHYSLKKKHHWHIDYFLDYAKIKKTFVRTAKIREECKVALLLSDSFSIIPEFGCSDCDCNSHLFYGFKQKFETLIEKLNFELFQQ
jgi:Uri superfamily endonuclease